MPSVDSENVYSCAATNGKECGAMVCHYNNDDNAAARKVQVELTGLPDGKMNVQTFVLDATRNQELTNEIIVEGNNATLILNMDNFSTYYIKVSKM